MSQILQLKRGLRANLPASSDSYAGQPYVTTDTRELFISDGSGLNPLIKVSDIVIGSTTPSAADRGKIWIDEATGLVKKYDSASASWKQITGFITSDINAPSSPDTVFSTQAIRDLLAGYYTATQIDEFLLNEANTRKAEDDLRVKELGSVGVQSGGLVKAQATPNMSVSVDAVNAYNENGHRVTSAAIASLAIPAADATNPRKDIVVIDANDVVKVISGVAGTNPSAPAVPSGSVLLAEINVPAGDTAIEGTQIADKRVFIATDKEVQDARGTHQNLKSRLDAADTKDANQDAKLDQEILDRQAGDKAIRDDLSSSNGAGLVGVGGTNFAAGTTVQGALDQVENRVDGVEAKSNANETELKNARTSTALTGAATTHADVDSRIEAGETQIKKNKDEIELARNGEVSLDARLDKNDTRVGNIESEVQTARGTDVSLDARLDGIDVKNTDQDTKITNLQNEKANLSGATFTGAVSVPEPTAAGHAATKNYVDNIASGISVETPVKALADVNVEIKPATARTSLTIDGVSLAANERVLLTAQSTVAENGVYVVQSDFSLVEASDVYANGSVFFVTEGTKFNNAGFIVDSTDSFVQFTGGAALSAEQGLYRDSNKFGILDAGVSTAKVADGAITDAKIAAAVQARISDYTVDETGIAAGMFYKFDGVKWVVSGTLDGGTF